MKNLIIDQTHLILLDMAKEFHRICIDNDIPYYMLGGTMLGAIRHKGFIPWDDDMDFGIPRKYYARFVNIAEKELPARYKMLTVDNSDYAILGIGKLSDTKTWVKDTYSVKSEEKLGLNIDIFPLDYTDDKLGIFSFNWYIRSCFKLQKLLFMETENRPFFKGMFAKVCQTIISMKKTTIPYYIDCKMSKREIEPSVLANLFGAWGMKEFVDIKIMGEPVLYDFEDTQFYGPFDSSAYLKQLYGDYMKLPPIEKRHIHSTEMFLLDD